MYAHRKNLSIPTYSCDSDGQQSACRFKCKVKVGEQVFESPGYFSKIKDAENAAAQVAVLSLSSSGIEEASIHIYLLSYVYSVFGWSKCIFSLQL